MLKRKCARLRTAIVGVLKGWKISTKLFILFSMVSVTIFLILQWHNYMISRDMNRNAAADDARMLTFRVNQYLSSYYDSIKTILLMVSATQGLTQGTDADSILQTDAADAPQLVKTLYVVTADGRVYCSNELVYSILGNDKLRQIEDVARSGLHGVTLDGPYYTSISSNTVAFFVPVLQGGQYQGVVIAEASIDSIYQNLMQWVPGLSRTFVLTSGENESICYDGSSTVLPYQTGTVPPAVSPGFRALLGRARPGDSSVRYRGRPYEIIRSSENAMGWNFYLITDPVRAGAATRRLFTNFLITALAGIAFILLSVLILSYFFTSPIRRFALQMNHFSGLDQLPVVSVDRDDEIGQLEKSYNTMLQHIRQLIVERKRSEKLKSQYEFKMLQSQISPHFLYNTLACIGSLARQHREEEIPGTIRALVGLLSFSFDRKGEFISIEEELNGLEMYETIQKMRYGPIFTVQIDARAETLRSRIPKLTLQPIVENALFHGVLPKQSGGVVRIRVRRAGPVLHILVADNGVGFEGDPQQILTLAQNESGGRFSHVGLGNIHKRMQLYYGPEYGLRIRSRPGRGTVVRLVFPCQEAETETGA